MSEAPKAAPGLVVRAAEIHAQLAKYFSPQAATKIADWLAARKLI